MRQLAKAKGISIHAPLAGSDRRRMYSTAEYQDFYPRSPRGERQKSVNAIPLSTEFLSTLPSRGATAKTNKPLTYFCMEMTKLSVPLLYKR